MTAPASTTVRTAPATAPRATALRLIGLVGIIGGAVMIIGGGVAWGAVSSQLAAESITVSDDADFMAGAPVVGPLSAYAQATVINHHALEASDGLTYAELEQDDPVRATVMNASFLRASLFTSVVSFGVAAFAMGVGVLVALFGWAITALVPKRGSARA
ncbi:hypothetical protein HD599_001535 [Conyzicola lurida]|uniref:Aromatic ring-opening dioxygenase LigA n=1 Tax=Conyzicola lurida TaxID=1172621 RepID=A0A841AMN4_9MICO|nr:aromatic ring-opening dioxygenase LigA [Conyzicola lurida]MBB5843212.1 hypothetical protein [Conyzicola lurida]